MPTRPCCLSDGTAGSAEYLKSAGVKIIDARALTQGYRKPHQLRSPCMSSLSTYPEEKTQ
jgi:hypothetical protein